MLTHLLLCFLCTLAEAVVGAAQTAIAGSKVNPEAVSRYQKILQSGIDIRDELCPPCQEVNGIPCPCGRWVSSNTFAKHFGGSIILTFVYEQNNTGPPSFLWTPTRSIPKATIFTATEEPTRTIIVPLPTTTSMHTTTTNDNVVGIRDTTSTHQHTPKPLREDITDTFYHRLTHGNDPHTIAIIIEHPTTLNSNVTEPITLLAYINTTLHSSFISSSLVTDLNLSPFIRPITTKPDYLPERDLSTLLGYETYPVGLLYLNLLAGKNNRHREPQFRVIHAPEDTDGTWHPDLVLGMHLLNGLQALQLNEEYSSNDTAAKDGLGVLVQRIFKNSNEDAIMAGHDEL